jgi:hypothetical protein
MEVLKLPNDITLSKSKAMQGKVVNIEKKFPTTYQASLLEVI